MRSHLTRACFYLLGWPLLFAAPAYAEITDGTHLVDPSVAPAAAPIARPQSADPSGGANRLYQQNSVCNISRPAAVPAGNPGAPVAGQAPVASELPPAGPLPFTDSTLPPATDTVARDSNAPAPPAATATPPSPGGNANGAAIYSSRCLKCHGPGRAKPVMPREDEIRAVQNGTMPRDGTLSAAEKTALLAYLRGQ